MRLFFIIFLSFIFSSGNSQTKGELDSLTKVLESVYENDQQPRIKLDSIEIKYGFRSAQVKDQWKLIKKNDSLNILIIKAILDKYGWLSEKTTSKTANSALFFVLQHADLNIQLKYHDVLKEAVKKGNATPVDYAYFLDRKNMRQGKLQVYGTQMSGSTNGKLYFFPIKDEPNVNKRRKEIGLKPLEKVALESGFVYKLPKVDSLKNKIVITGFVIGVDQTPISDVKIKFGSRVVATTNTDGFYKAIIDVQLLKDQLYYTKEGYIVSDPPLQDEGKEVYEIIMMMTRK